MLERLTRNGEIEILPDASLRKPPHSVAVFITISLILHLHPLRTSAWTSTLSWLLNQASTFFLHFSSSALCRLINSGPTSNSSPSTGPSSSPLPSPVVPPDTCLTPSPPRTASPPPPPP